MLSVVQEGCRHGIGGEDKIDESGIDGAAGHLVELGRIETLDDDHSAAAFDFANAGGAMTSGSGQDDSDSEFFLIGGERAEEGIDGSLCADRIGEIAELEVTME